MSVLRNYLRKQLAGEISRRNRPVIAPTLDLNALCFPEQREFVECQDDLAVALCGRRAGKSSADRIILVATALQRPGTISVLVTQTRAAAKKLFWASTQALLRQLNVPFETNATELIIRIYNGSEIWLAGAKDTAEIERLRGHAFAMVIIDEAGAIRDSVLRPLVEDVLQWALVDHQGKLRLTGTPPPVPVGYFVERFAGMDAKGQELPGWWRKRWTIYQNTKIPNQNLAAYLERIKSDRGITEGSVTWRREVLAELVYDRDALVLSAFDLSTSTWQVAPVGKPTVVLGVDIGWQDADAIVALGWYPTSPNLYVLEEFEQPHQTEEQLSAVLRDWIRRWNPIGVVGDTGGNRKTIEGIARRLQHPIKPAHKPAVVDQFQRLNDEFRAIRMFVPAGGICAHDAIRMRWEPGKVGQKVAKEPHSNALPALSYAYSEARAYYYKPEPEAQKKTAMELEMERMDR